MKFFFFSKGHKVLISSLTFMLLMSFYPVKMIDKRSAALPSAEMSKLVDKVLKDSIFKLITQSDVKRFLRGLDSNQSTSNQKWAELGKKKKFTQQETDYILSRYNFSNSKDFHNYANLLISLGRKYGIDKMEERDQKSFFASLRKSQTKYIRNNNLLEKEFKNSVAATGGIPPECWKCVYDYRDCINGADGDWVITYTPLSQSKQEFTLTNGSVSVMKTTYFSTPSRLEIDYINQQYSTSSCDGIYRNCISSCIIP